MPCFSIYCSWVMNIFHYIRMTVWKKHVTDARRINTDSTWKQKFFDFYPHLVCSWVFKNVRFTSYFITMIKDNIWYTHAPPTSVAHGNCCLQVNDSKLLRINSNSTRRARWTARLGLVNLHCPFSLALSCLFPEGGLVPAIEVKLLTALFMLLYLWCLSNPVFIRW